MRQAEPTGTSTSPSCSHGVANELPRRKEALAVQEHFDESTRCRGACSADSERVANLSASV